VKVAVPVLLLALVACDNDDAPKRAPPPAPVASLARSLGVDAGELEPSVDQPAPAGDFKAEMDAFTTLDACAQQHAAIDPLVGDAVEAIGYDTLVRDACRVLDAAKSRDARRCEAIDASTLRARCLATVAEIVGDADACPFWIASRPDLGREPACLALASHDARLCAATLEAPARVTCTAIAAHDAAPCKALPLRADQQRCARDEKRWAGAIPAADAHGGAEATPQSKATIADKPIPLDVSRGVVLVERIDGAHFVVGPMGGASPSFVVPSPHVDGTLAFEVVAPADAKRTALDRVELSLPQREPVVLVGGKTSTLAVKILKLERKRGGVVQVTLDGHAGDGLAVQASLTTFVRDVVKATAMLASPRFGDAGSLR
jgi:hypothetical protein